MNQPPKPITHAFDVSPRAIEQRKDLGRKWQALREACQQKHLDGSPGTPRGRRCACGKGMGHGEACEMLAIIRNFFLTADPDKLRSWEHALIDMMREVIS